MRKVPINKIDLLHTFLLFAIAAAVTAVNYFYVPPITIILYAIGALYYILLISTGSIDTQINSDYIQTGEAAVGSFAVLIILRFFINNIYIVITMTFLCVLIYEIYLKAVISPKKNELLTNGIIIQVIISIIIYYILTNDKTFDILVLEKTLFGYAHFMQVGHIHAAILAACFAVIALAFSRLKPEFTLFSQGEPFLRSAGFRYFPFNILVIITRSILMTATIFLLGWLGGTGYYFRSMYKNNFSAMKSYLTIIFFAEGLLLLSVFFDKWLIIVISSALSYFIFLIYIKKRSGLYDRNQ